MRRLFLFITLAASVAFILITLIAIKIRSNNLTTKAEGIDTDFCINNCGGDRDPCTGTKIGDNYYDPVCCGEIKKTGDPFACGNWVNRTWCFPDECSTIPADVNRQRCGGARFVYCEKCKEHGCYSISPTIQPTPSIASPSPTLSTPTPTIIEPTLTSTPTTPQRIITQPRNLYPTSMMLSRPTQEPSPTAAAEVTAPPIRLPFVRLPKIKINISNINRSTSKPLGFFEYLFQKIGYYDKILESSINSRLPFQK